MLSIKIAERLNQYNEIFLAILLQTGESTKVQVLLPEHPWSSQMSATSTFFSMGEPISRLRLYSKMLTYFIVASGNHYQQKMRLRDW